MRMRRKPNLIPRMERCARVLISDPEARRGNWRELMPEAETVYLELGCGKGRFTAETAEQNPKALYIAVERVPDAMVIAMERVCAKELHNVFFVDGDAALLPQYFAPGEVSRIYINFCDPWPGNRHAKRRLTHPDFLLRYRQVLTEDGEITPKYEAFREVIGKYTPIPEVKFTTEIRRKAYGKLQADRSTSLFGNLNNLASPVESVFPQSMEKLDQGYGYILYESALRCEGPLETVRLWGANDRASIYVDEKPLITLYDRELLTEHTLEEPRRKGDKLSILVENMGRVNFGPNLERQRKGIDGSVQLNGHNHYNWTIYNLPLEDLSGLDFSVPVQEDAPGFYEFVFDAEETGDTFLELNGWGKGCVFVNGFNIGRFWEIGPQKRLYIPAPLLKKGNNTILVFETEGKAPGIVELCDEPDLG